MLFPVNHFRRAGRRIAARRFFVSFLTMVAFGTLTALPVLADCCRCIGPNTTGNVCLTVSTGGCATIKANTTNASLASLTCDDAALTTAQCKITSQSGGGICQTLSDSETYGLPVGAPANPASTLKPAAVPTLNVQIPGLQFATQLPNANGQLQIPYFAQYIASLYKYLIGVSVIAAAIMIVYGGFLYIIGSSIPAISKGKDYVINALIGLFILFASYTLLSTINPDIKPTAISISQIQPVGYDTMESTYGFQDSNPDSLKQSAQQQLANGSIGSAAPIDPSIGENIPGISQVPPAPQPAAPGGVPPLPGEPSLPPVPPSNPAFPQKAGSPPPTSIAGVVEKSAPLASQRLSSYCTSPAQADSLQDYDAKIVNLVRTVLGFYKICYLEQKCAYVRGGGTSLATGKVSAGAGDVPFLLDFFRQFSPAPPVWTESCWAGWEKSVPNPNLKGAPGSFVPFSSLFYAQRKSAEFADYEYTGSCYQNLKGEYQTLLADKMTDLGLFGGDCGTTLSAMYMCAGGKIGRPFNGTPNLFNYVGGLSQLISFQNLKQSPGPDFVAWYATDQSDLKNQLAKAGGAKFGDIFIMGSGSHQHNFMYTGGRADVPFEIFEMGGSAADSVPQKETARATIPGLKAPVGGMRAMGPGGVTTDDPNSVLFRYIEGFGSRYSVGKKSLAYPVYVARPYSYRPCETADQCNTGEACHCTANDKGNWGANKCSLANICHKSKGSTFCTADDQCVKGSTCQKNVCQPAS